MIHYTKYEGHTFTTSGKRKKYDNTIYTFDIETTSYLSLNNEILPAIKYENLSENEKSDSIKASCMYIWMVGINDIVYYGRSWLELISFLRKIEENNPYKKYFFVHNLSYEFQYIKSVFKFEKVYARKKRKVIRAELRDFNIEFRCTYYMSNVALKYLPSIYNLPVQKLSGDLDYNLLRHSLTPLTDIEKGYCENDCLVVYYYIKKELETYKNLKDLPLTSTGHVRGELKEKIREDITYKQEVKKSISDDPHIYNLLCEAFAGGYTHANWFYTSAIVKNVDSFDFASSYPYVMVSEKYPCSQFKKCNIKRLEDLYEEFAYLLVVKYTKLNSKCFNNFISKSKARSIKGGVYDNGRVASADELVICLTDIDFKLYFKCYNFKYEIIESYYSLYKYLPRTFYNFILDKYVIKTEYKGVVGKEIEYNLEKQKFNSLYGMSVTNTIRDEVLFDDILGWYEETLSNEEIQDKLHKEKEKGFMNFAWGCFVTAYARRNLIENIIKLDKYVLYADTDSIKIKEGYNREIIEEYNKSVLERLKKVSKDLNISYDRYAPKDIKGISHPLGVFELETKYPEYNKFTYSEFITHGSKKYATKSKDKEGKDTISITVAGVPKEASKSLKKLEDFQDGYIFKYEDTHKNTLVYNDNQEEAVIIDYLGNSYKVKDKSGCCLIPTTYELGKAFEYVNFLNDMSSHRARYKE